LDAVNEPIRATRREDGLPSRIGGRRCPTHDLWAEPGQQIRLFLNGMMLSDVVHGNVQGRATAPRHRQLTRA